jgi:ABC-2 type transport system ATP-binding protein
MTANEYLRFFAEIYGIKNEIASNRIREILDALRLDAGDKKTGEMSKGMQRKVMIARALINDPEYLIMDEMTSGLDPTTSKYLTDFVLSLKKQDKTIIFSAHNLYQVESICDRVLMMNKGKKVAIGTMQEIRKMCGGIEYEIEFNVKEQFDFAAVRNNGNFIARTKNLDEFNRITGWIAGHDGKIINIKTMETSLEDIFLKLMNQN